MNSRYDSNINLRVHKSFKEHLKDIAEKNNTTMSSVVRDAIKQYLKSAK